MAQLTQEEQMKYSIEKFIEYADSHSYMTMIDEIPIMFFSMPSFIEGRKFYGRLELKGDSFEEMGQWLNLMVDNFIKDCWDTYRCGGSEHYQSLEKSNSILKKFLK